MANRLKSQFIALAPSAITLPVAGSLPASAPPPKRQNGGPESDRIATRKCELCFIQGAPTIVPRTQPLIPVVITSTPASNTVDSNRDLTLYNSNDPTNPDTRFTPFFPPPVPPPWFLQVPPYRVTNEPKARILPCVGPRQVDASYGR